MKAKSLSHKVISYSPGGYKCPCCGPHPKKRQEERRAVRRALNRLLDRIEREEAKHEHLDWYLFPEFDQDNLWTRADDWWHEWKLNQDSK